MLWNTGENKMINGFILSLQFFTRIPINKQIDFNKENLKYSIFFLPLVGIIIGGIGGLVYKILQPHNNMIGAFLALLITIILTGGLHLDGLSDTVDGFFSNREKEETLKIMKDSRVGAFGVLSIVLIVLFKFILISNINKLPLVLALSFANSRLVVAWIISSKKVAKDNGLGKSFSDSNPKKLVIIGGVIYTILISILHIRFLIPLAINFLIGQYISQVSYKKINGLSGDVYGAIIEIGEAISLLSFWGVMIWI